MLCSQVLAEEDIVALEHGYAQRADERLAATALEEVRSIFADPVLSAPARVLAALVANDTIDLQIAVMRDRDTRSGHNRIFHDKLGLFRDEYGNSVIFKGSMNETWAGLSADGNLESVDVAASWMGTRDRERTRIETEYFERLWCQDYPGLLVRPFPNVAKEELRKSASANWHQELELLLNQPASAASDPRGRTLRPHQAAGIASWKANDRRGILAFATGSGKTFTAITVIREALRQFEPVVVIVPDQVLFAQWWKELLETTADLKPQFLRAGAGHNRWREHLQLWTSPAKVARLVLATVQTASTADFRSRLGSSRPFLVADEVHRLGSPRNRLLLNEQYFGDRLGLSATPERAGDPEGTQALLSFFGGVLEPRYTLADAVRDGVLTHYFYRPHPVHLTPSEGEEWNAVSRRIAELRARLSARSDATLEQRLQNHLIQRSRIVKHAAEKIPLSVEVIRQEFAAGQRWIVYCEDVEQLEAVSRRLLDAGLNNLPFHSKMTGDRAETLKWLERRGGIVVAIKCLDEGVDIPSVTHALILASSKNPREFIQRRGRVLRRAPGKALAYIHDCIVLPPESDDQSEEKSTDPILAGELARAIEFAQYADNPASAADLRAIAIAGGVSWVHLTAEGYEGEDD